MGKGLLARQLADRMSWSPLQQSVLGTYVGRESAMQLQHSA